MKVLETERLILRRLSADDAAPILRLLNEPSFLQFIGDRSVRTLDGAREYIASGPVASYERFGYGMYMTEVKSDGTPIGLCGLVNRDSLDDVDVGFAFFPEFWKQGYGYESAVAVMDHAKTTLGLTRLVAITAPDNRASVRLLEKLGLSFERMIRLPEDTAESRLFAIDF